MRNSVKSSNILISHPQRRPEKETLMNGVPRPWAMIMFFPMGLVSQFMLRILSKAVSRGTLGTVRKVVSGSPTLLDRSKK